MDLNKLRNLLMCREYTDIELVFSNGTQEVIVHANKIILASSCDYFYKLFNFNKNVSSVRIVVDVPEIVRDIVLSFYGINTNSSNHPEWRYVLEVFKTRHFFCLDNDVSKLYNLSVPLEGFDLFLEVASQFDISTDRKLIKTIRQNLPEKYDLAKLLEPFVKLLQKKPPVIVSGSHDNTIKIWDTADGSLLHTLKGHTNSIWSIAISPDGLRIVSGSNDKTIRIWNADNGSLLQTLTGHNSTIYSVAISPDSLRIVSGSHDETIRIWNAVNGSLLHTLKGHTYSVRSVAFSPDGSRIVSGGDDGTIKIWDAVNGSFIRELAGRINHVTSVVYSPDGLRIISGGHDNTIKIWNTINGSLIYTLKGHTDSVMSVAISPDSLQIVSCSKDKTIKIWDAVNGSLLCTLSGHTNMVMSVTLSPDGSQIVFW